MKNVLLGLLLFVACPSVSAGQEEELPPTPLQFACDFLEIDCEGITMPMIIYTDIMGELGYYGAYMPGEHIVFIDPQAPAATVVHEVTHYMLWAAGARVSRCTSEEAARRVHHAWEGTEYNEEWRQRYGCAPIAILRGQAGAK
jgi:hypothetical protein